MVITNKTKFLSVKFIDKSSIDEFLTADNSSIILLYQHILNITDGF